ncbi:MAG TPA: hypothetical protein VK020_01220, partial [Microlunatus sp.]|nr:hypothetical protein [Microlunatus sp.]
RRRRPGARRAAGRAEAAPVSLPYPHRRNDCERCRERDADMIIRRPRSGRRGRIRCCRDCAGEVLAELIGRGLTTAARPVPVGRR